MSLLSHKELEVGGRGIYMKSPDQDTVRQALDPRRSLPQSCLAQWLRMGRDQL